MSEIRSAIQTDSYLKIAVEKTAQLIFKAGFKLTSENEKAKEYLQQRLSIMSFGTGIPFKILLSEVGRDLSAYSNAFLVKSRVDKIQGGLQAKGILGKNPVGGYFRLDPTVVEIKQDTSGKITGYKYTQGSEEKTFKAEDIVHLYIDREADSLFGTPRFSSALEDIKILRKIEGNSLSLIYRFAMPLYQMIIGLPEPNMQATNKEIKEAEKELEKMPNDGIIITNERTAFKAIGAEGKAIDIVPYLNYYEKRVFTALNVSEAMMGRGGNKQDADSMEGLMHDSVKYIQSMISVFIENSVFNELLLEGGFNPILKLEDIVTFDFNEINLDTKIKMENHELVKFQSNLTTFEEARRSIGKISDDVDESRLYSNMITTKNAIDIINAKIEAEKSTNNGNILNGKTKETKPNDAAKNTNAPTNAHGTTSAKVKESLEIDESAIEKSIKKDENEKIYQENFKQMYKLYKTLGNDIKERGKLSDKRKKDYINKFIDGYSRIINNHAKMGVASAQLSVGQIGQGGVDIDLSPIKKIADDTAARFVNDLVKKVETSIDATSVIDFMAYRVRFACEYLSQKAYWSAFIQTGHHAGIEKAHIIFNENSKHSKNRKSIIKTDSFQIDDIPPFSPYCNCRVAFR